MLDRAEVIPKIIYLLILLFQQHSGIKVIHRSNCRPTPSTMNEIYHSGAPAWLDGR